MKLHIHPNKKNRFQNKSASEWEALLSAYIGGVVFVVSGGVVFVVSGGVVVVFVVSIGAVVVESVTVLSEEPATLLDELHADVAIIREPAKARLKINFFMGFCF